MEKILIQDDFFDYVDELRDIALEMEYRGKEEIVQSLDRLGLYFSSIGWIGYRTDKLEFLDNILIRKFKEEVLDTVRNFYNIGDEYVIESHFHYTLEAHNTFPNFHETKFHIDPSNYSGLVYLTPDPPKKMGTSILDGEKDKLISVENVYNRLIAYPGNLTHGPTNFFGDNKENSRMTFTFFITKNWNF